MNNFSSFSLHNLYGKYPRWAISMKLFIERETKYSISDLLEMIDDFETQAMFSAMEYRNGRI